MKLQFSAIAALICASSLAHGDVVEVQQVGMSFVPNDLVIEAGTTVRWVHSDGSHTVTEGTDGSVNGDEAFHSSLTSSASTFEVTFDDVFLAAHPRVGDRYDYFCLPHFGFGMVGSVTVGSSEPGSSYCSGDGSGTACPCGNAGGSGEGCANDTGSGGVLSASGSTSIGSDDLVLSATNLTSGPGLFFQGNNAVNSGNGNPFGDGLRCAGGNVVRLEVRFANAGNGFTTESTISVATKGGVSAGQTKRYQFWYRDSGTSPCSSLFNLTNGYELTWGA
jgi:plastocyanin